MAGRVRVFSAISLDGFLAGEGDDLSWLGGGDGNNAPVSGDAITFDTFLNDVGAMLMGRRTYDVVSAMEGEWFYGALAILVATHRPLDSGRSSVQPASGDIHALVARAREVAVGRDVYIDGGDVISQALDAGLVDDLTLTVIPTLLGRGVPLYAGAGRHALRLTGHGLFGEVVQLRLEPRR